MDDPLMATSNDVVDETAGRRRRWPAYGLLILLAALVLLLVLVPSLLSTAMGRSMIVGAINDSVRGSVTIDALSLSWLGGQSVRGVEILDPTGAKVGRLEELSTELSLLEAVQRKLSLGQTTIRGLSADVVVDETGVNNLARAFEPTEPSTTGATPLAVPFTGNIELADAHMTVKTPNTDPVVFDELAGTMRVEPEDRSLGVSLQGQSRQGDQTGKFTIKGQVSGLISDEGALSPQTAQGNLQADIADLPMDSVDAMLGLKGLLSALAGNAANLRIQASGTADLQDLQITADSPNIKAEISAQLNRDRFVLTQPASVRLNVTPDLLHALSEADPGEAALRLVEPFPLRVEAERLELSVPGFNLGDVALRGGVAIEQPARLTAPDVGDVTIRGLSAVFDAERLGDSFSATIDGEVESQEGTGKLEARATLDRMINEAGAVQLDKMRADVTADISNIPTLLIDQIAGRNGMLVHLLGPKIDLSASAVSSGADKIDATLTLDAGPLKATDIKLSFADIIALTEPARIQYALSPQAAQRLLGEDPGYTLMQPAELTLELNALAAPRPEAGGPVFQPARTKVQGSLTSERLAVSGIANFDTLRIDGARFDLSADSLDAIRLRGSADVSEAGEGILSELSSSSLKVQINADTGLEATGTPGPISAQLKLAGEGLGADVGVDIPPDLSRATLTEPGALQFVITPGLLRRLGMTSPGQATLASPAAVDISVSRLDLPLAAFSWADMQAGAALRIDELMLAGDESMPGVALRNADVSVDYDGPQGSATVRLAALTPAAADQEAGKLKLDATLGRLLRNGELSPGTAEINAEADIDALPTALLSALSGQAALVPIVGDVIDIDASAKVGGDDGATAVEVKTASRYLSADAGFRLGDELSLSRPASARLTLTPAGYDALMDASSAASEGAAAAAGYALAEDATFDAQVSTLRWPLTGKFDPSRAAVAATAKTPRLSLRDRASGQSIAIETFEMKLEGSDLSKPIDIEINGRIRDSAGEEAPSGDTAGRIGVSGQAADVFSPEGQLNVDGLSLRLEGGLQQIPTALLDELLGGGDMLVATLGKTTDVSMDAHVQRMTGPVSLRLRSDNATADVVSQLGKDGLVLTEPLVAEVQVTQAFGKLVLGKIHPIFETAQSSERAVRFEVPPEGTLIPIRDYDISKVVIPRMVLDLGTLTLKSGWLLQGAIGLAQQLGALKSSGKDQWTAQFTPAVLKMSGGEATYERRLDLLLDESMHLATWGKADIANDRVNLILAFMPETLEKVFGLSVAPDDALRLSLRGALSGPSVDFAKAGLEVERLRQQQRLARKDPLAGALVGALATTAIGGGPIPLPSVEPLPWGELPDLAEPFEDEPIEARSSEPAEPEPEKKSVEQQAIEGLMGILRKKKE